MNQINNKSDSLTPVRLNGLVSNEALRIFQWLCFMSCEVIGVFGTVTNIINMICFAKQGFKDSINVSLFGLAISDLGCLVTLLWTNLCFIPAFQEANLPFETIEIQYLTTAWPHIVFTRVTSWITALVTLERCLCVTMPLKVKSIVTPRRVTVIIVCLFVVLICSVSPIYCVNRFATRFSQYKNRTVLGLAFTEDRVIVEQIAFAINNVFVPFMAFLVIIVCMVVMVGKLQKQSDWRMKSAANSCTDAAAQRDQRVTRMVIMISTLFVVCFIPSGVIFMAMAVEPELSVSGRYLNLLTVVYGLGVFLESMNSSMNIFIYYYMSSKYRDLIRHLFPAICEQSALKS